MTTTAQKETCPYCKKEFEVKRYGRNIPCPYCKGMLNIVPDPDIFFHINGAVIGVAIPGLEEGGALNILGKLISLISRQHP